MSDRNQSGDFAYHAPECQLGCRMGAECGRFATCPQCEGCDLDCVCEPCDTCGESHEPGLCNDADDWSDEDLEEDAK